MNEAPSAAEWEAALGALLPPGVAVAVWSPALGEPELGPREAEAVARAVPKRRTEFARGRACAREALRRAGYGAEGAARATGATPVTQDPGFVEIPVGAAREPVWPDGFTGSITHCDGFVAAVAARVGVVRGIGLDGEVDRPLPDGVAALVIAPEEGPGALSDAEQDIVRFSAKESIHKAVFPLTGVWLDFLDAAVELEAGPKGAGVGPELEQGTFRARPAAGAVATTAELDRLRGRYARVGGLIVTVSWIPCL